MCTLCWLQDEALSEQQTINEQRRVNPKCKVTNGSFKMRDWSMFENNANVIPQQDFKTDGGVFMMLTAHYLSLNAPPILKPDLVIAYRERIACNLLDYELFWKQK
jgi:hypothetical protein